MHSIFCYLKGECQGQCSDLEFKEKCAISTFVYSANSANVCYKISHKSDPLVWTSDTLLHPSDFSVHPRDPLVHPSDPLAHPSNL